MKINWKVRFKNKTWLTMFISLVVGFVFNILKAFDVTPAITENVVMNMVGQVLTVLGLLGVIVDPTTAGIQDSDRAMSYDEPWQDGEINETVEDALITEREGEAE
jgi:phi LC3 family holin